MCQQNYALGEYRQAIDVLKQTLEPLWGALVRFAGAISRSWIAVRSRYRAAAPSPTTTNGAQ
jgi:hypothetical protein